VTLRKGKPTNLRVAVKRFTPDKSPVQISAVSMPEGLSLKPAAIGGDQDFAEISLLMDREPSSSRGEILTLRGEDNLAQGSSKTQFLDVKIVPDMPKTGDENLLD
jgi:hypothetical protein